MSTPTGTLYAYATVADLQQYRDWRQMADWIATNTTGQESAPRGTLAQFVANPVVQEQLLAASGEFESAILRGGIYFQDDIVQLLQANPTIPYSGCVPANPALPLVQRPDGSIPVNPCYPNAAGKLAVRIVSWLTIGGMSEFKTRTKDVIAAITWAREMIEQLQNGQKIFGFAETVDAYQGEEAEMYPPGSIWDQRRTSREARPFFGQRGRYGAGGGPGWGGD